MLDKVHINILIYIWKHKNEHSKQLYSVYNDIVLYIYIYIYWDTNKLFVIQHTSTHAHASMHFDDSFSIRYTTWEKSPGFDHSLEHVARLVTMMSWDKREQSFFL